MQQSLTTPAAPSVQMPVMLMAEVQDSLLVVVHDLSRLDGLLAHTMENLMERFTSASANLADPALMNSKELDFVRSTEGSRKNGINGKNVQSERGIKRKE